MQCELKRACAIGAGPFCIFSRRTCPPCVVLRTRTPIRAQKIQPASARDRGGRTKIERRHPLYRPVLRLALSYSGIPAAWAGLACGGRRGGRYGVSQGVVHVPRLACQAVVSKILSSLLRVRGAAGPEKQPEAIRTNGIVHHGLASKPWHMNGCTPPRRTAAGWKQSLTCARPAAEWLLGRRGGARPRLRVPPRCSGAPVRAGVLPGALQRPGTKRLKERESWTIRD